MKKKQEWLKFLIPVVAVLIIVESVIVVTGLNKKKVKVREVVSDEAAGEEETVLIPEEVENALVHFVFETDKRDVLVGEENKVGVNLVSEIDVGFDSLELYIKYDPSVFDVSALDYGDSLPKPVFIKASEDKGLIVANFMVSEPKGLVVASGDVMKVLDFSIRAKTAGEHKFLINTGGVSEGSVTMLVENGLQSLVPFSSEELIISVSE